MMPFVHDASDIASELYFDDATITPIVLNEFELYQGISSSKGISSSSRSSLGNTS